MHEGEGGLIQCNWNTGNFFVKAAFYNNQVEGNKGAEAQEIRGCTRSWKMEGEKCDSQGGGNLKKINFALHSNFEIEIEQRG